MVYFIILLSGLYPSTFADPRFRNEDSVFVTHECSSGGQEGNSASKALTLYVLLFYSQVAMCSDMPYYVTLYL